MYFLIILAPVLLLEPILGFWRRRRGYSHAYVLLSSLIRTLVYSPCIVPVGMMVALPVPLSVFLIGRAVEWWLGYAETSKVFLLLGIPEIAVFLISCGRAERNRVLSLMPPKAR